MTEPAEPEHVEKPQPSAARRGGQWVGRMLFATLLMLACLGAAGYWFGWPWAEQTWQRFEAMESKLVSIAPWRTGKSGMPWPLRSQSGSERSRRARLVKMRNERSLLGKSVTG